MRIMVNTLNTSHIVLVVDEAGKRVGFQYTLDEAAWSDIPEENRPKSDATLWLNTDWRN